MRLDNFYRISRLVNNKLVGNSQRSYVFSTRLFEYRIQRNKFI